MNSFFTDDYTSRRLQYTGNKSTYVDNVSGVGFLRQLSEKLEVLNNIQFGDGYKFFVEFEADIVATDKIVIGDVEYEVRGVKSSNVGSISCKEILMVRKRS